jgi:hypothetical protein
MGDSADFEVAISVFLVGDFVILDAPNDTSTADTIRAIISFVFINVECFGFN